MWPELCFLHHVHDRCVHPASSAVDAGSCFPAVMMPDREADHMSTKDSGCLHEKADVSVLLLNGMIRTL